MFHKSNFSHCNAGKCHIRSNYSICQRYREYSQRKEKKNSVSINADTVLSPFEVKNSKVIWILHGIKTYLIDNDHKAEKALSWH